MAGSRKYDIVLFGATGFTGQLTAQYLARAAPSNLVWAVAGRSEGKLKDVVATVKGVNPKIEVDILIGDASNKESLNNIARQTRVVLSTAGPFRKYSAPLVESCASFGTHFCDITGETDYVHENVVKYHDLAKKNNAKIISCCGFDSVPSDIGTLVVVNHIRDTFGAETAAVDNIITALSGGASGGTLATGADIMERASPEERKGMGNPLWLVPKESQKGRTPRVSSSLRWNALVKRWTVPFVMAPGNSLIVHRSNFLAGYGEGFKYEEAQGFKHLFQAVLYFVGLMSFIVAFAIRPIRNHILFRFFLPAPGQGPSLKTQKEGFCKHVFVGRSVPQGEQPSQTVYADFVIPGDPGYSMTAVMVGEAALSLALETAPQLYGCVTPATGLGQPYIERLRKAGFTIAVRK